MACHYFIYLSSVFVLDCRQCKSKIGCLSILCAFTLKGGERSPASPLASTVGLAKFKLPPLNVNVSCQESRPSKSIRSMKIIITAAAGKHMARFSQFLIHMVEIGCTTARRPQQKMTRTMCKQEAKGEVHQLATTVLGQHQWSTGGGRRDKTCRTATICDCHERTFCCLGISGAGP